jgi:DNA-binding NarL/FixJ family response regulator
LIRVIVVDDHFLVRRGLRETLAETGDIEVVGEAGDYGELRQLLRNTGCDVMLPISTCPGARHRRVACDGQRARRSTSCTSTYPEDSTASGH